MFIMRRIDGREHVLNSGEAIRAYNQMQSGKRVKVEWGIGGVKMHWRCLQGRFRRSRRLFSLVFRTCCILTNFLHRRRRNMSMEVVGEAMGGAWGDEAADNSDPDSDVDDVNEDDFNYSGDDE